MSDLQSYSAMQAPDGGDEEFEFELDESEIAGKKIMDMLSEKALGDDAAMELKDVGADTWGVMLYVVCKDIGDIVEGQVSCARMFRVLFSCLAMVMNLGLQFSILYWVFSFVVNPSVAVIQKNYATFHTMCYDADGMYNEKRCGDFGMSTKQELCQAGLSQQVFLGGILFLWTLAMLTEFRENFNLQRHISQIAHLPAGIQHTEQVLGRDDEGEISYLLIALNPVSRAVLYVIVVVPKYLVILFLTLLGWRWLASSENFSDLILNSLALQFICTIDELIFSSVFPEKMVEKISGLKLAYPKVEFLDAEEKEAAHEKEILFLYGRSLCFTVCAALCLCVYISFFQSVLPGYSYDLAGFCARLSKQELLCKFLDKDCFPMGPKTAARMLGSIGSAVGEI